MSGPKLTKIVRALPNFVPFVGPEAQQRARQMPFKARLGANESLFGPSPKAIAAMQAAASDSWMYADPESFDLRQALAKHHGIGIDHIVVGEGIDGLLGLTVRMFAEPGDVVVTSDGAYPTFNFHVAGQGATLIKVPFSDDKEDLSALCDAAHRENARIVYVSNPNNPMGTWWSGAEIAEFSANLPAQTLLVLDEAYADTAPQDAIPEIAVSTDKVIRYRTFSKAYGLAGARIGYAIAPPDTILAFEKVRNHYGINRVGQVGALAAIEDQDYLRDVVAQIAQARDGLAKIALQNGLTPIPSAANFVTIDCGGGSAKAERVLEGLLAAGIFVRRPAVAPLDRCIRVSCGPDDAQEMFANVLSQVLARDKS